MAIVIITEASLSFLGFGVPVHIPTWGSMLSEGRSYINRAPWLTIFPWLGDFYHGVRHQFTGRRPARRFRSQIATAKITNSKQQLLPGEFYGKERKPT